MCVLCFQRQLFRFLFYRCKGLSVSSLFAKDTIALIFKCQNTSSRVNAELLCHLVCFIFVLVLNKECLRWPDLQFLH